MRLDHGGKGVGSTSKHMSKGHDSQMLVQGHNQRLLGPRRSREPGTPAAHRTRKPAQSAQADQLQRQCSPRGGTQGAKPGSGVQRFWGPLGASKSTPRFNKSGSRKQPPRGPLEPRKGSRGLSSSGSAKRCVFKGAGKEGGPLRGLEEVPFSRMPQLSRSYPWATDKLKRPTRVFP